ncbi:MAG: degU 2 [Chthoniobacteraceae bacterium]|nr:degU 2 [Chthoniobacteraceae bacterium]
MEKLEMGTIQTELPARRASMTRVGNLSGTAMPTSTRSSLGTAANRVISVLIADDHTIVRQGIRALIECDEKIKVVGEADTGRSAIHMVKELNPDIVLMDIAMPLLNGLESTKQLIKEFPRLKIVVLSSYSDDIYVTQVMEAGAAGYLIKQTAANELVAALKEVQKGKAVFSPSVARRLKDNCRNGLEHGQLPGKERIKLTPRELEVLQLIAEGYANKQIASELTISIKTVEKHRQRVMDKLNIHQTAGLTRYAIVNRISESHMQGGAL